MFFALLNSPTAVLVWAVVAHLAADWLFQTEWMAINKVNWRHPAAWVHAGVYTLFMALVFPLFVAILIGLAHVLMDTRTPVRWWLLKIKGMKLDSPNFGLVSMGVDQSLHICVIALAALALATR
jgi:predicted membrane metal-binding protein